MRNKRAIVADSLKYPRWFETALKEGKDLREQRVFDETKRDGHRTYYGWYKGIIDAGWQANFIAKESYLVPELLAKLNPWLYIRALAKLRLGRGLVFSLLRRVDLAILRLHLLGLILVYQPLFILFPYTTIGTLVGALCKKRGVKTISFFGVVPELGQTKMKQVSEYDHVLSGYDLPLLWPEISAKFVRIILAPPIDSALVGNSKSAHMQKDIDVCIFGGFGERIFNTRSEITTALLPKLEAEGIGIQIYGYDMNASLEPKFPELKRSLRGRLYGEGFWGTIRRSKIILTIPSDEHIRVGSARPQGLMEIAAAGTFQIAYDTQEARDLFTPGSELVVFTNVDDLFEQIKYYLGHDEQRETIAARAYERFATAYAGEKQIVQVLTRLGL